MKTKIGVLGSCVSRDAFNSNFVHNYKEFFDVKISAQRTSLISVMQEPIPIDNDLIEIKPLMKNNKVRTYFLSYDFNKSFLNELIEKNIDYLIIDNYLEVKMGILYFHNLIITNNDWDLPDTQFYKELDDKFILKITEHPEEYFCIWSRYCDLFFKFLKIYCPNIKVILNRGRQTDKVIKSDKTTYINSKFTLEANIINPLLDKLDSYIINNFEVYVLDFDYDNTFADENHLWGLAPIHYSKNYYYSLVENIKNIVKENNLKNENPQETITLLNEVDSLKKDLKKANYEARVWIENIKTKNINDSLKFYNRARIDIKNFGSKNNKIEIIDYDVLNSKINFPNWFKSNEGEGVVIENEKNSLNLTFKCVQEGLLKIFLRGPDIRDKNQNLFPVFIDFTNFTINNKLIFNDNTLVWHNEPYIFQKEVKDSEIINMYLEWLPFNSMSVYKK